MITQQQSKSLFQVWSEAPQVKKVQKPKQTLAWIFEQAINLYPYYFQQQDRWEYINKKMAELANTIKDKLPKVSINYIAIYRVKKIGKPTQVNVQQMWLVDKNSLQVAFHSQKYLQPEQIFKATQQACLRFNKYQQLTPIRIDQKYRTDYLIIGRKNKGKNSIVLQDKSVSNVHLMILISEQHFGQTKSILNFLFCYREVKSARPSTKSGSLLSVIDRATIKLIVKFMGRVFNNKYQIRDSISTNGTYFYPRKQYELSNQFKDTLIFEQNEQKTLKVIHIIKKTRLTSLSTKIDSQISCCSIKNKNIRICNRNIQLQNSVKKQNSNFQVALLKLSTSLESNLYLLYSQQAPYQIVKYNVFQLKIMKYNGNQQAINQIIGTIHYKDSKWFINSQNPEGISFSMKGDTNYGVSDQIYLRLGKHCKFTINFNLQYQTYT